MVAITGTYLKKPSTNYWFDKKGGVSKRANVLGYKLKNFVIGALTFKFKNLELTFSRFSKSSNLCEK